VIQRKYEDMFAQLSRSTPPPAPVDALPGWLARRRRTLEPARAVVDALPTGAVAYEDPAPTAGTQVRPVAGPAPRPSPGTGRQAVRSGPHGRGRRSQGGRPDRPKHDDPKHDGAKVTAAPPAARGGDAASQPKGGSPQKGRQRQDGRRHRPGRHRRPPRRNG
jgi:hypothetical protein